MKRSIISLCVAGLFAGSATLALAADDKTDVKAQENPAETSQSRSSEPTEKKEMNDAKAGAYDDKTAADFRKADKDNDGTLDRKEAKKVRGVSKNFDAIDADKDGTVSMEEIDTWMAAHPNKKGNM
jgi:hypothetical protein